MGVFLSLLLALTLIALGERALYDLNRLYNPHYAECNQTLYLITRGESCPVERHAFQQLLLHSYVSLPLFLIFLGLMLYLRHRRLSTWQRALFRVSSTVAIVFGVQFVLEVAIYLFRFHKNIAWYFIFILSALVLTTLMIYIERKNAKKKAAALSSH